MPEPNPDGTWPPLANANRVGLALNGLFASAPLQTTVNGPSGRKMLVQASYQDKDGKTVYMNPTSYEIPTRPTALVGGRRRRVAGRGGQEHEGSPVLGELIDPSKNCKLTRGDVVAARSTCRGRPPAELRARPKERRRCVTTSVQGDFAAIVKVERVHGAGHRTRPRSRARPFPSPSRGRGWSSGRTRTTTSGSITSSRRRSKPKSS